MAAVARSHQTIQHGASDREQEDNQGRRDELTVYLLEIIQGWWFDDTQDGDDLDHHTRVEHRQSIFSMTQTKNVLGEILDTHILVNAGFSEQT